MAIGQIYSINSEVARYFDSRVNFTKAKIRRIITPADVDAIVQNYLSCHLVGNLFRFHKYYLRTINNRLYFLCKDNFFLEFKGQYALQGMTADLCKGLEEKKRIILESIDQGALVRIYSDYFENVQVIYKGIPVFKTFSSFFTKLVHTFAPADYCALDNPIKKLFDLESESFFFAFLIISRAYKEWAAENNVLIQELRQKISGYDRKNILHFNELTDIKLLDMVFWTRANNRPGANFKRIP